MALNPIIDPSKISDLLKLEVGAELKDALVQAVKQLGKKKNEPEAAEVVAALMNPVPVPLQERKVSLNKTNLDVQQTQSLDVADSVKVKKRVAFNVVATVTQFLAAKLPAVSTSSVVPQSIRGQEVAQRPLDVSVEPTRLSPAVSAQSNWHVPTQSMSAPHVLLPQVSSVAMPQAGVVHEAASSTSETPASLAPLSQTAQLVGKASPTSTSSTSVSEVSDTRVRPILNSAQGVIQQASDTKTAFVQPTPKPTLESTVQPTLGNDASSPALQERTREIRENISQPSVNRDNAALRNFAEQDFAQGRVNEHPAERTKEQQSLNNSSNVATTLTPTFQRPAGESQRQQLEPNSVSRGGAESRSTEQSIQTPSVIAPPGVFSESSHDVSPKINPQFIVEQGIPQVMSVPIAATQVSASFVEPGLNKLPVVESVLPTIPGAMNKVSDAFVFQPLINTQTVPEHSTSIATTQISTESASNRPSVVGQPLESKFESSPTQSNKLSVVESVAPTIPVAMNKASDAFIFQPLINTQTVSEQSTSIATTQISTGPASNRPPIVGQPLQSKFESSLTQSALNSPSVSVQEVAQIKPAKVITTEQGNQIQRPVGVEQPVQISILSPQVTEVPSSNVLPAANQRRVSEQGVTQVAPGLVATMRNSDMLAIPTSNMQLVTERPTQTPSVLVSNTQVSEQPSIHKLPELKQQRVSEQGMVQTKAAPVTPNANAATVMPTLSNKQAALVQPLHHSTKSLTSETPAKLTSLESMQTTSVAKPATKGFDQVQLAVNTQQSAPVSVTTAQPTNTPVASIRHQQPAPVKENTAAFVSKAPAKLVQAASDHLSTMPFSRTPKSTSAPVISGKVTGFSRTDLPASEKIGVEKREVSENPSVLPTITSFEQDVAISQASQSTHKEQPATTQHRGREQAKVLTKVLASRDQNTVAPQVAPQKTVITLAGKETVSIEELKTGFIVSASDNMKRTMDQQLTPEKAEALNIRELKVDDSANQQSNKGQNTPYHGDDEEA